MHENELTSEEQWLYMPKWKKALIVFFATVVMPIACSFDIAF